MKASVKYLSPADCIAVDQVVGRIERHVDVGGEDVRRPVAGGRRCDDRDRDGARGRLAVAVGDRVGERIGPQIAGRRSIGQSRVGVLGDGPMAGLGERRQRKRVAVGIRRAAQDVQRQARFPRASRSRCCWPPAESAAPRSCRRSFPRPSRWRSPRPRRSRGSHQKSGWASPWCRR